jgi:hypothetical protein
MFTASTDDLVWTIPSYALNIGPRKMVDVQATQTYLMAVGFGWFGIMVIHTSGFPMKKTNAPAFYTAPGSMNYAAFKTAFMANDASHLLQCVAYDHILRGISPRIPLNLFVMRQSIYLKCTIMRELSFTCPFLTCPKVDRAVFRTCPGLVLDKVFPNGPLILDKDRIEDRTSVLVQDKS